MKKVKQKIENGGAGDGTRTHATSFISYFLPTYIPYPKYLNKLKILLGIASASF